MVNIIYAVKVPSFVLWTLLVIFLIVFACVGIAIGSKHLMEKRKRDCFNLLNKVCQSKENYNYQLEYSTHHAYDFFIENEYNKYYIKLINNPNNQEICVNNAIKWQLRNGLHDKGIRFVEGVEELMRMDIKNNGKNNKKIFIIYPNSRALLKVINECEMEFITPATDIYGATILTYKQLEEDYNLLKL